VSRQTNRDSATAKARAAATASAANGQDAAQRQELNDFIGELKRQQQAPRLAAGGAVTFLMATVPALLGTIILVLWAATALGVPLTGAWILALTVGPTLLFVAWRLLGLMEERIPTWAWLGVVAVIAIASMNLR